MDKVAKQYISEVKALFPIMGKAEKTYINSLVVDIEDYSLEENINTIQELYNHYRLLIQL